MLPRFKGRLAVVRTLAAARVLLFPHNIWKIWRLDFFRSYLGRGKDSDVFFFLTHNFYLSKYFTLRQRVDCAIYHYRYERQASGTHYHQSVYQSPAGLILWQREVNGTSYSIALVATEENRIEGDLSALCLVDGKRVCRMAFSYVQGALFDVDLDTTIFVTRNQTDRSPELQRFRNDFKQNSPPYFLLAALCGIAMGYGFRTICMIKHDAQIAYHPRYEESFKNSYTLLWEAFGAEELDGKHVYKMSIPLDLNPLKNIRHRSRAIARRQNWLEIMINARQAILQDRLNVSPLPIDIEASKFLPLDAATAVAHGGTTTPIA